MASAGNDRIMFELAAWQDRLALVSRNLGEINELPALQRVKARLRTAPEFYAGDKEFYKKAVQANREMLSKDGIVTPALSNNTYRIISSFNESVKNAKIDIAKTYDPSFAENANKALH